MRWFIQLIDRFIASRGAVKADREQTKNIEALYKKFKEWAIEKPNR